MSERKTFTGLVQALARGYASGAVREEGETFQYDGVLGGWMKPVRAERPEPDSPKK